MSGFVERVKSPAGTKLVLQGNEAFALGVVHAGFHAADGYPGTPSTEVIHDCLSRVQDRMVVGWDVNEAVAVAVGVGHSAAGSDTVVTMKTPGAFQAGDAITTAAFYHAPAGALVYYIATDYIPSSTQHVIDLRYFFYSSRLPVLEPRDHQDFYDFPRLAADLSRRINSPVVILANGILCHSEGMVRTAEPRVVPKRELPENFRGWMGLPNLARKNYDHATKERMPAVEAFFNREPLARFESGDPSWGILASGESSLQVREALAICGLKPARMFLAGTVPFPKEAVLRFAADIKGPIYVFEEGDRWVEERCRLAGINVSGKPVHSSRTEWTPGDILSFLADRGHIAPLPARQKGTVAPVPRPPGICPGCPYRAFGLAVAEARKKDRLTAVFGDIGCSTLLYFMDALDTCMCMGASDSMRQGMVLSRPEQAARFISVLGDSCECHSGLDSTRNAVFRGTPGVKVILDNRITAMTGGQPAPSSGVNLAGNDVSFSLRAVVSAETPNTKTVDAYNLKGVKEALKRALERAEAGDFSCLILEGACVQQVSRESRRRRVRIDVDKCRRCGQCDICPGIELAANKVPHFTALCTNCGGSTPVCMQRCPFGAIEMIREEERQTVFAPQDGKPREYEKPETDSAGLPRSLRVAVRGVGGQGNLFFGRVLSQLAMETPYARTRVVKGDTHGMAQLGGAVISTFACGDVHSPVPAPGTVDVLAAMEMGEVLRPGFLDLLKPGGTVVLNRFRVVPPAMKPQDYPGLDAIRSALKKYRVVELDAHDAARQSGDETGRSANVVMLGLLSTLDPLNRIPEAAWRLALSKVTASDAAQSINNAAFGTGRHIGSEAGDQ
ncbi:MAG: 2-oxoacid:acceptor oxidoreductase family protein [Candidatus Aminicenantes bacterium]|nr:2-oxoacid:acceptor oxidoreductase family protein [Candidatus Aminicenantes bacterium]